MCILGGEWIYLFYVLFFRMETFEAFVTKFLDGDLEPYLKSEPIPDNSGDGVKVTILYMFIKFELMGFVPSTLDLPFMFSFSSSTYVLLTGCRW